MGSKKKLDKGHRLNYNLPDLYNRLDKGNAMNYNSFNGNTRSIRKGGGEDSRDFSSYRQIAFMTS